MQQQRGPDWKIGMTGNQRKFTNSYHPSKIKFSEIIGLVQSVRNALECLKLYFDDSIIDTVVTETN